MHRGGHLQEEVHVLPVPEYGTGHAHLFEAKGIRELRRWLQAFTGMERKGG